MNTLLDAIVIVAGFLVICTFATVAVMYGSFLFVTLYGVYSTLAPYILFALIFVTIGALYFGANTRG